MANSAKAPNITGRDSPDKRSQSHTGRVNMSSEIQPMIISKQTSDEYQDQNGDNQIKAK